jgi:methyl-CpG-binding domain protein 2
MEQQNSKSNEPSALPLGWRREEIIRKTGLACGKVDIVYFRYCSMIIFPVDRLVEEFSSFFSPDNKKYKSKYEIQRVLGDKVDLSLFDYKTGRQSTAALRKQKRLKNPVYLTKGKTKSHPKRLKLTLMTKIGNKA